MGEWYPVEFLYQAFGKAKNVNSTDQVTAILSYNDDKLKPDSYMESLKAIYSSLPSVYAKSILDGLNLRIDSEPLQLEAKVLEEPTLEFARNKRVFIKNGSWDLRGVEFHSPSDMSSFAVVDLSRDGQMINYLRDQFRVCEKHKMDIPHDLQQCTRVAEIIKVHAPNSTHPEEIDRAIKHAITNARDYFIHDNKKKFRDTNTWFKSRAYHSST
eukprot:CAMPEP_0198274828 /NCGR_PEP_ID=MMETSP1447-20131203/61976_1 /TAXON_ID=420782 /ORGANISM="Chaetoceros dichaeta, Strain CCMP1751" /LENGTH=212 /DNA_ID=CAMNT_0043969241 /DNA_START=29 /DNA_END=663 /DNA_ORIENTATION=+